MTNTPNRRIGATPLFNMRMPPKLRADIEAAAKASGATLTGEIVGRLERSLREETKIENRFGSIETYRVMMLLSEVVRRVEDQYGGASWLKDEGAFSSAVTAMSLLLEDLCPERRGETSTRLDVQTLGDIAQAVWTDVAASRPGRIDRLAPIRHDLAEIIDTRHLFEREFGRRVNEMVAERMPAEAANSTTAQHLEWLRARSAIMQECMDLVRAEMHAEGKTLEGFDGEGP